MLQISQNPFFTKIEVKNLNYQRNCKLCNCPDWLREYFVIAYHVEHLTYLQICEIFEKHGYQINIYNCHVHRSRHLTNNDFKNAEATKARWEAIDAKLAPK